MVRVSQVSAALGRKIYLVWPLSRRPRSYGVVGLRRGVGRWLFPVAGVARRDVAVQLLSEGVELLFGLFELQLELRGIGVHWPQVGSEVGCDRDLAPNRSSQHFAHLAQHSVEVDARDGQRLPPSEGEQLPGQLFGALDRP